MSEKTIANAIIALAKRTKKSCSSRQEIAGVCVKSTGRAFVCDGVILFDTWCNIDFDKELKCYGIDYDKIYSGFDLENAESTDIDKIIQQIDSIKEFIKQKKETDKIIIVNEKAYFYYDVIKNIIKCFDKATCFAQLVPIKHSKEYYVLRICDFNSQAIIMPLRKVKRS